jgi:hypothetical protein
MNTQLGVKHFFEMMSDSYPKWEVVAVKVPGNLLIEHLAKLREVKRIKRDVSICEMYTPSESSINLIPVATIKNNSWTVICGLWPTGESWAKILSQRSHSRSVMLMMHDTDASTSYEVYENGEIVESAYWSPDSQLRYESKIRLQPNLDLLTAKEDEDSYDEETGTTHNELVFRDYIDLVFQEEEIYIPCCWAVEDYGITELLVEQRSIDSIEDAYALYC